MHIQAKMAVCADACVLAGMKRVLWKEWKEKLQEHRRRYRLGSDSTASA